MMTNSLLASLSVLLMVPSVKVTFAPLTPICAAGTVNAVDGSRMAGALATLPPALPIAATSEDTPPSPTNSILTVLSLMTVIPAGSVSTAENELWTPSGTRIASR